MTTITLHNYLQQIKELAENHQADEAVAHCRHILQRYPRHVDTYRTLAEILLDKEDFQDATDLLQRILSAIPDDFVAHVGLSIVYKADGILPQAIWHLEQALEQKPYNEALQEELRDLHARNGASVPDFIAPTQSGLARLYLSSEMYPAAIQAFRQALSQDKDNMGLKVALTEALWLNNERVEAVALCLEILEELPNCIKANAILSEIWLQTGRIVEAQPYLNRLQGLTLHDKAHCDDETAVCRAFRLKGAPPIPESVTIQTLDEQSSEMDEPTPTADWASDVSLSDADQLADDGTLGWLEEVPMDGLDVGLFGEPPTGDDEKATAVSTESSASIDAETDWFIDPGEATDGAIDEILQQDDEDADLADWLKAGSVDFADRAGSEAAEKEKTGFTDMFTNLEAEDTDDQLDSEPDASGTGFTDMFADLDTGEAHDDADSADELSSAGLTELFASLDTGEADDDTSSMDETAAPGLTELFASLNTGEADDDTGDEDETISTGFTDMFANLDEAAAIDGEELIEGIESDSDISDFLSELTLDEPETAVQDDKLAALADASEQDEDYHTGYTQLFDQLSVESFPEDDSIIETNAEPDESVPDWLSEISDSDLEQNAEDAADLDVGKMDAAGLTDDWLADPSSEPDADTEFKAADDSIQEEAWPLDLEETESAAPDDTDAGAANDPADIPTWMLGGDRGGQDFITPPPLETAESATINTDELQQIDDMAAGADIPTWLLGGDQALEETGDLENQETLPESVASASDDESDDLSLADWLLDEEPDASAESVAEPEPALDDLDSLMENEGESLDWLAEEVSVGLDELEEVVIGDNDDREISPQDEPEEISDDMDWLEQLASPQPDSQEETPPEMRDDEASYASRIAAGEGAAIDEPPTQASLPDESFEPDDDIDLDWLEQLSAPDSAPTDDQVTLDWSEEDDDEDIGDVLAGVTGELKADMDWLDSLADEAPLDQEEERPDAPGEDLGWLDDLATDNESDQLDASVEPTLALPELDDALAELPDEMDSDLDWLTESEIEDEAETESGIETETETVTETETDSDAPEDLDDAMAWLEELAAKQGAPLEELPSLSDDLVEETAVAEFEQEPTKVTGELNEAEAWLEELQLDEAETESGTETRTETELEIDSDAPEDLDDAMAWLEELAAKQGAPLEELPSLSDDLVEETAVTDELRLEPEMGTGELDEAEAWLKELQLDDAAESNADIDLEAKAETEAGAPEDLDDAMTWLEELAAKQGAPLEELPSIADVVDESPEIEPAATALFQEEAETAESPTKELADALDWLEKLALEDGVSLEQTPRAEAGTAVSVSENELEEALNWLEQVAQTDEPDTPPAAPIEPEPAMESEGDLFDLAGEMPEDPDEALAWLEQMAPQQGDDEPVADEPPVSAETAEEETAVAPITSDSVVQNEETTTTPDDDIEADALLEMPDDPDAAMAWLEQLAARQGAPLEELPSITETPELETPALETAASLADALDEGSEVEGEDVADAMAWLDDLAEEQGVSLDELELEGIDFIDTVEPEAAKTEEPDAEIEESRAEFEAPEDMDDAMAWLEELAAQQGAALEELPTLSVKDEERQEDMTAVEPPSDPISEEAEPEPPSPEPSAPTLPASDKIAELDDSDDMAQWLALDEDDEPGQTDWLDSLTEPDVTGWLEAEEEATMSSSAYDRSIVTRFDPQPDTAFDTGPLPPDADLRLDTGPLVLPEEDIATTMLELNEARLEQAREALTQNDYDNALQAYQSLVEDGGGMMTLIADLETAASDYPQQPELRHLLGDAYMRNGQLQKALDTYRLALDQI